MKMTTSSIKKDRQSPVCSILSNDDASVASSQSKRRPSNLKDGDLGHQPSYMKPTNRYAA